MKIKRPRKIKTPWGTATIDNKGYYKIKSRKEGNRDKYVHRLIYEQNFGEILDGYEIHHINGDKLDNNIDNLKCLSTHDHMKLHNTGKTVSDETRRKISESQKGKTHSYETKRKISKSQNTSGYLNVYKRINKKYHQGFTWVYTYYENGKQKTITSVDIDKLKKKVLERRLPWEEF